MEQFDKDLQQIAKRLGESLIYCRDLTHPDNSFPHKDESDTIRFYITSALNIVQALRNGAHDAHLQGLKELAAREALG